MRFVRRLALTFAVIYLLPVLASAAYWTVRDRPDSWRAADWGSARILPEAADSSPAAIYVFSAATGGFKGAVASHSWIVTKQEGATRYERYDKVGWGSPIRRNGYAPDGRWYSNAPRTVLAMTGPDAARLIPQVEAAIAAYPYAKPGGYRIWPGPNSNTFVAHVLRSVPDLGVVLPPDAVGRDYLPDGRVFSVDADGRDVHLTLNGLLGVSAGVRSGFEVHVLGLVAGFDLAHPAIKLPGIGRIGI